jgi:hypothetical protein
MMLIIEFDKDYVRECPVRLARGCDKTLYDHCMLAFHLSGPDFTIYFYLSPLQYHLHSDHSDQDCRVILLQEYNEDIAFATRF